MNSLTFRSSSICFAAKFFAFFLVECFPWTDTVLFKWATFIIHLNQIPIRKINTNQIEILPINKNWAMILSTCIN